MTESPQVAEADASPTYSQDTWAGLAHYTCLLCGREEWAEVDMAGHMTLFHEGTMRAAPGLGPEALAAASVAATETGPGHTPEAAEADPAAWPAAPTPAAEGV